MKPRLKSYARRVSRGSITLVRDAGFELALDDPDGSVGELLDLLDGARDVPSVGAELRRVRPELDDDDVAEGIAALDEAGLLEDEEAATALDELEQERYFSNLAFFGTYATLGHSRFAFQERLRAAHVLVLGVGGLGSTTLFNLAGMGVGRLTLLDADRVELKNFSRQFLYAESDLGLPKVQRAAERIRSFNSSLEVEAVEALVRGPEDVTALLDGVDLVVAAIDQPREVRYWVNDACVPAGVPFVSGGMRAGRGSYFAVEPGRSGCMECWNLHSERLAEGAVLQPPPTRTNRGIGPAATLLGGLVSMEALRLLTRFAPPVAAGRLWLVDFASGRVEPSYEWPRVDDCAVCGADAGSRAPSWRASVAAGR